MGRRVVGAAAAARPPTPDPARPQPISRSVHEVEQYLAAQNIDGLIETSPGAPLRLHAATARLRAAAVGHPGCIAPPRCCPLQV